MENTSILSHVSIGTNDYDKAISFYDTVLLPLGIEKVMEHENATAYGKQFPEFWVQKPYDNGKVECANGIHISFLLDDAEIVDKFHQLAIEAGAIDEGKPGPRAHYGAGYYGAFIRDLDGHKIEAMFWDASKV